MQARSALFDLYGDHLRSRGGRAPVAALVRLLAPLQIAAPAVRTAVSRMVRQGWLEPVRTDAGPGYALTPKADRRLDEAAQRVYRTHRPGWSGRFDLIVLDPVPSRTRRNRIGSHLAYLGYGQLGDRTWIAPRPHAEADSVLAELDIRFDRFISTQVAGTDGAGTDGAASLVRRAWDLAALGRAYEAFVAGLTPVVDQVPARGADETAYAARFTLVHAWRAFLFQDPQLPPALLPTPWPGGAAAAFFDKHAARLRPAADRFVDNCLDL